MIPVNRGCACASLARLAGRAVLLALALTAGAAPLGAQDDPMFSLASRSPIVVLGTVAKVNASEEPHLAPTPSTVIIRVRRMFAGSEFAGDLSGQTATVILSKPGSVQRGATAYFFGNPRFIGKTVTIADDGELPATASASGAPPAALARGIQARRDAPILARLAKATAVFRGIVERVRAIEAESMNAKRRPRDEHDPDWQLAQVRVTTAWRGAKQGSVVAVVFPASGDILWLNSPKLATGKEVLVLAHPPQQEDELPLLRATGVLPIVEEQHALVVSQPYDVLQPADEQRLVGLLRAREAR